MINRVEYNSQSQSQSSIDNSSDSQNEQVTAQQRQQKKNTRLLKNAILYRFQYEKQAKKLKSIFEAWKNYIMMNSRTELLIALRHYETQLMTHGFNGIIDYAMVSVDFKQKIMMFYYRLLIGKCFNAWKAFIKLVDTKNMNKSVIKINENKQKIPLNKTINVVNRNLDQLTKPHLYNNGTPGDTHPLITLGNNQQRYPSSDQIRYSQLTEGIAEKNRQDQKQINKGTGIDNQLLNKINRQQVKIGLKQIQIYTANPIKKDKFYEPCIYQPRQIQKTSSHSVIQHNPNTNIIANIRNEVTEQISMTISQKRENLMDRSRRSTESIYNQISRINENKSRRKLKPIIEAVKLPVFDKKAEKISDNQQNKLNIENTFKKQIKQNTNQLQQQKGNKSQTMVKEQKQKLVEPLEKKSKLDHLEHEQQLQKIREIKLREEKEKEITKQKQQRKNKILAMMTKGKLMQLVLIEQLPTIYQNQLQNYKKISIETLYKIKLL